ncbi:MAG TPA: PmoA family protein [Tepidisphaeraceae bacterium]|jgi:hypothetical protein
MTARHFLFSVPILMVFSITSFAEDQKVLLIQADNHVSVLIDGKPFTDYWYGKREDRAYARPFFFPVLAADGTPVTADHYGQKEHPHHNSLWVGHGEVNGADHWALKGDKTPKQRHLKFEKVGGDTIIEDLDWEGTTFEPIMHERRTLKFTEFPDKSRGIDFTLEFMPIKESVTFQDTKEAGLVAVRVNDSIPEHKAVITNSTGATGEKNIWGKPADWADISGQINGKTYGVAAFDSPANPLHPQQWHIREYGLMGANPFGLSYYDKKIAKHAGDFKMPAGKTTTFHYLVVIHEGDAKAAKLDEKYKTFTGK